MYTFIRWALALVVIPAVIVAAQPPAEQVVPEGTTIKLLLLRQKSVQKELKLTPDQVKQITDFTHKQHEAFLEARKLGEEERKRKHRVMEVENAKFLDDTLMEAQRKRLGQVAMQFTALHELTKPEVARELKLSDEQVRKFKDLQGEARKELVGLIKERGGRKEKLAKLREDTREKILALLTDEQKAKVREMAGAPFTGEIVLEEEPAKDK